MKYGFAHLLWVVVLALVMAACSSTNNQQPRQSSMVHTPEYYRLYGPGAEQPPDYGTHSGE